MTFIGTVFGITAGIMAAQSAIGAGYALQNAARPPAPRPARPRITTREENIANFFEWFSPEHVQKLYDTKLYCARHGWEVEYKHDLVVERKPYERPAPPPDHKFRIGALYGAQKVGHYNVEQDLYEYHDKQTGEIIYIPREKT